MGNEGNVAASDSNVVQEDHASILQLNTVVASLALPITDVELFPNVQPPVLQVTGNRLVHSIKSERVYYFTSADKRELSKLQEILCKPRFLRQSLSGSTAALVNTSAVGVPPHTMGKVPV